MDSSLVLLGLLILLVLVSLGLDSYRCTLLSKSGLALLVGGIAGVVLAALHTDATAPFQLHHSIFFDVLLPPIIYEAGFSVERTTFFRNFGAVLATAIWGTLISACATGLTLYFASSCGWIPSIDWVEAFLFGALLSAVDPVATLAVFQKLNVPPVLFNVVFGESVLNDAVAIALYKALSLTTSGMTFPVLALVVCQTFGILVGSICVSMLVTLLGSAIFVHIPALRAYPAYEILLCVCVSWTTYFAAECCAFSGIVALFFSGILTSHYHYHVMSPVSQLVVHHTLETASFVSETLVYVFVGVATALVLCSNTVTSLPLSNHHHPSDSEGGGISWSFLGWTTLSLFVGRALNVFPLLSVTNYLRCNQDTLTVPMMVVMWLTGLRGAVAVALVTDWSYVQHQDDVIIDHKQLMVTTTLFLVIGTTWVVGGLTGPLLNVCGLLEHSRSIDNVIVPTASDDDPLDIPSSSPSATPSRPEPDQNVTPVGRRMSSLDESTTDGTRTCATIRVATYQMWHAFDDTYMKPLFGGRCKPMRNHRDDDDDEDKGVVMHPAGAILSATISRKKSKLDTTSSDAATRPLVVDSDGLSSSSS
ncbi:hypothetical protein H257_14097 [Aphanomyces astaci]|uniref:Cation/H+ exchanger transmembrane domain-containing protein n=1 Tax=Aphanomyces astaci TaxID=112090 RepID=W4FUT7_APHAT|nr:hypothetical protein H257_14097 [Aphanomyces astaci]ETV70428.1 hypothetical protein H257_14097 [Aphanomyces astaci]|eukprot:XP_009840140.1 hypothetical protein H257_14097 [Aphanomyces astaci]